MLSNKNKSAFQSHFSGVPKADIQRSSFNRSYTYKTSIHDDLIVPMFCQEIIPGDTINLGVNSFTRMNPTVTPVMDNIWQDVHFFFVPNRLTWDNFQKFMGEQTNPGDSTDYLVPQVTVPAVTGFALYSMADYFGLPIYQPTMDAVCSFPFRAYNLIYNEWYRDQNLQNSLTVPTGNGPDTISATFGNLYYRNKRHDYFTSCLPWPQKGPSVPIPSSASVPVLGIGKSTQVFTAGAQTVYESDGTSSSYNPSTGVDSGSPDTTYRVQGSATTGGYPMIRADLTANTEATINALRQAFQLQKLYERDARGGTRYTEIIRAHFGVVSPDARLQRPEFLGGSSNMVNMHPLASSVATASDPQGTLTGNGTLINTNTRISKSFTEHGYVIGLVSLRGDQSYSQGVDRHWSRRTRWDYYWPALAHIGEQSVLRKELRATGNLTTDNEVFGYQERYAEMRYSKNTVTALMRPDAIGSLAVWNLSPLLAGTPTLNSNFIISDTPLDRSLLVPSEPAFLLDFYFDFKHARPMPTYSVPGLVDHF